MPPCLAEARRAEAVPHGHSLSWGVPIPVRPGPLFDENQAIEKGLSRVVPKDEPDVFQQPQSVILRVLVLVP